MGQEDYFLKHIGQEKACVCCHAPARFVNLVEGYSPTCKSKKCCTTHNRATLRANPQKFAAFQEKVQRNVSGMWATIDQSDRIKKARESKANTVAGMSDEERRKKFGWLNKIPLEDREEAIRKMVQPMQDWWKTAPREIIDSTRETIFRKTTITLGKGSSRPQKKFTKGEFLRLDRGLSRVFGVESLSEEMIDQMVRDQDA